MLHTIRVIGLEGDPLGTDQFAEIKRAGLGQGVTLLRTVKVYRFEGLDPRAIDDLARIITDANQTYRVDSPVVTDADAFVEIAYKPGVMNPEAASLVKFARDRGHASVVAADSSVEYHFYGEIAESELDTIVGRLLMNKAVQMKVEEEPQTLVIQAIAGSILIIPIRTMDDDELMSLSKDKLFLNLDEMRVIRSHFRMLGRNPTDGELETLAQTWSEHCSHKTFRASLIVGGVEKPPLITRLKQTATRHFGTEVVSAFEDNSGVMRFYDGFAICAKVETHNSPSAIEPYGGAATGSGGVFRDIMGTGQGAKVIASTDMFCFAPPDFPDADLPSGCLRPDYLLRRVVAGVRDYGNRMGIPTCNGSVHFHPDFCAKPTVIVGAYGILPVARAKKGVPQPGDLIVALGGRTGRDGIHGATFSSGEMTERTASVNSSAVQIGNAIEEKRMADAIIVLRDRGLIQAVTDCGAGGFASAIGEMGSALGVHVTLEHAPLKYAGLAPWEIWLSESQERMVLAIRPDDVSTVLAVCKDHNVEGVVLGHFTGNRMLLVTYNGEKLCDLSMEFLHDGLPQRVMAANWVRHSVAEPALSVPKDSGQWTRHYLNVMGHPNVCSKEPFVRMYDHGVQGTSALPPFTGVHGDGPSDAVVLRPLLGKPYGLVVSHGLNPILNRIDPYWGSVSAAVEAIANLVAVGGDPSPGAVGLIDNFIWPFPDEHSLGGLDKAVNGCVDVMNAFGHPFISGKDSLSGTYRSGNRVIRIPPVLCVSAFGRIPDVHRTISADFKSSESIIVLVGTIDAVSFGGSVFYDTLGFVGNQLPKPDLAVLPEMFRRLHRLIASGAVLAAHDISEGGLAAALAEMCIGGDVGAMVNMLSDRKDEDSSNALGMLFAETSGCFLLELPRGTYDREMFAGIPHSILGMTCRARIIAARWGDTELFQVPIAELKRAWQAPMEKVFHHAH